MGLNLQLQSLTMPSGSEFEGTRQALQDSIPQYLEITGEDNFTGINYGPTTPDAENRDRPWFKTDESFHSLGWFDWDGEEWDRIQVTPQNGTVADAPTAIAKGQLYYATDINMMLVWNGTAWVTMEGASGEIRFVRGTNITTILANYPGWTQVTDLGGNAIAVAGTSSFGTVRVAETTVGEEEHTQTVDEMPSHSHSVGHAPNRTGVGGANPLWANDDTTATGATGGGTAFNVMQPTTFLFCIQKS